MFFNIVWREYGISHLGFNTNLEFYLKYMNFMSRTSLELNYKTNQRGFMYNINSYTYIKVCLKGIL